MTPFRTNFPTRLALLLAASHQFHARQTPLVDPVSALTAHQRARTAWSSDRTSPTTTSAGARHQASFAPLQRGDLPPHDDLAGRAVRRSGDARHSRQDRSPSQDAAGASTALELEASQVPQFASLPDSPLDTEQIADVTQCLDRVEFVRKLPGKQRLAAINKLERWVGALPGALRAAFFTRRLDAAAEEFQGACARGEGEGAVAEKRQAVVSGALDWFEEFGREVLRTSVKTA